MAGATGQEEEEEGETMDLTVLLAEQCDEARAYRHGNLRPPNAALVWQDADYGGPMGAALEARQVLDQYAQQWRTRYPVVSQPPVWCLRIPGGYALVPNSLYLFDQNRVWRDLLAYADTKRLV